MAGYPIFSFFLKLNAFKTMKPNLFSFISCATLSLCMATGANAQDVYMGVGLPGLVTVGYASPINANWGWRAQYAGGLNEKLSGYKDDIRVTGSIKSESVGVFADWFPVSGSGFRVVGGLSVNDMVGQLNAQGEGVVSINGVNVNMGGQFFKVAVKLPSVTPYLGIGYGHHRAEKGLGFYADAGVLIGKLKTKTSTSLVANGLVTQADVDAQARQWRSSAKGAGRSLMPSVSLGVVYRF